MRGVRVSQDGVLVGVITDGHIREGDGGDEVQQEGGCRGPDVLHDSADVDVACVEVQADHIRLGILRVDDLQQQHTGRGYGIHGIQGMPCYVH